MSSFSMVVLAYVPENLVLHLLYLGTLEAQFFLFSGSKEALRRGSIPVIPLRLMLDIISHVLNFF